MINVMGPRSSLADWEETLISGSPRIRSTEVGPIPDPAGSRGISDLGIEIGYIHGSILKIPRRLYNGRRCNPGCNGNDDDGKAVSRIILLGAEGKARVVKVNTEGAKPRPPENFEKLDALRGVFPPSQKLKDKPTKCTIWVNGLVIKKQFSRATKGLSQDGDEIFGFS
jgi:hypothetical protein